MGLKGAPQTGQFPLITKALRGDFHIVRGFQVLHTLILASQAVFIHKNELLISENKSSIRFLLNAIAMITEREKLNSLRESSHRFWRA